MSDKNNEVMDVKPEDFDDSPLMLDMNDRFSEREQYEVYAIPKKSGGKRMIEAPKDDLKAAQRASLRRMQRVYMNMSAAADALKQYEQDVSEILEEAKKSGVKDIGEAMKDAKNTLSDAMSGNRPVMQVAHFAHAFARERNIASGAMPHVGAEVVLTADLSDFFPSVKFAYFDPIYNQGSNAYEFTWESKSYKTPMHYIFGSKKMVKKSAFFKLYMEKILPELKMHFCDFGDGKGLRLPQGAPASPFLSNVLMCRLDYRSAWRGYPEKVQYSRYADDLIFSGANEVAVKRVYARVVGLLAQMGMKVNKRKYTLKKGNQRKKILGLVVNERLNTTRYFRRRLRAMKHHCSVILTIEHLGRERGFQVPHSIRPFMLSKTEGMSFGDKMNKVVKDLVKDGADISMEDLQSKKLLPPGRGLTKKISGHIAFQHMIENPPESAQDSISYCACQEMLAMA